MSKFLFTTLQSNDLGLVTRALPIAKELLKQGHDIYFVNNNQAPIEMITNAGFDNILFSYILNEFYRKESGLGGTIKYFKSIFFRLKYGNIFRFFYKILAVIPTRFNSSTSQIVNMDHFFSIAGMLNKNTSIEIIDAHIDIMKKNKIDYVIDFWNPYSCIASNVLGLPLITVNQADVLPGGKGFIWWENRLIKFRSAVPVLNKVLKHYQLSRINIIEELLIGDLTLTIGMKETDPLVHKNYNYIGALLWQDKNISMPDWFNKLDNKPTIWVYSGNPSYANRKTDFDSDIVIKACIKYLANKNINVILTTGHHKFPQKYLPLPSNFYFCRYLPAILTASKCDLMIHHGGYGSCQTALYTGTPSLIIPTFSERESNARRISALGAGEVIRIKSYNGKEKQIDGKQFEELFDKVFTDPYYKNNAIYYGNKLKSIGGEKRALQLIQEFIYNYEESMYNRRVREHLTKIDFRKEIKKNQKVTQTILPLLKFFN